MSLLEFCGVIVLSRNYDQFLLIYLYFVICIILLFVLYITLYYYLSQFNIDCYDNSLHSTLLLFPMFQEERTNSTTMPPFNAIINIYRCFATCQDVSEAPSAG